MADTEVGEENPIEMAKVEEEKLKYLEFVRAAAFQVVACLSIVYNVAKDKSGPLKPGVQNVEEKVKPVIDLVYEKYQGVPMDLLKLADQKVDGSVAALDRRAPAAVKRVSFQAVSVAHQAPEVVRAVASEVKRMRVVEAASGLAKGVSARCEPVARGLYDKYEPVAQQCAVSAWGSLHRLPLFPQVAQAVVPTAAFCSEKYNQAVCSSADRGYKVASYLPLVPIEKLADVFQGDAPAGKEPPVSPEAAGQAADSS